MGFSLTELLVVIAIIAVLLSIMFPVLGSFRKNSQSVQCMHNLRKLGMAWVLYSNDNKGYLPPIFRPAESPSDSGKTWGMILTDLGLVPPLWDDASFKAWYCPGWAPASPTAPGGGAPWTNIYGGLLYRDSLDDERRLSEIPGTTPLLADSINEASGFPHYYIPVHQPGTTIKIHLRHNKKANLFFADGHGESVTAERLGQIQYGGTPITSWSERESP